MENTNEKKVLISSKIPVELEKKIKQVADAEKRTVSNTIFVLLETHPRLSDAPLVEQLPALANYFQEPETALAK